MKNVGANRITSTVQEVNVIIPPDGGYAWVILVAALFSNIVVDGIAFSFGTSLLPSLSQELNLPASKLAVINSVQLGTYYLFGPIACAIINHYGFRAVGVCGCVIAFSGIFVASHIASFPAILAL
ncbi:Monocarboxylate transporter 2, partial [Pseudolycoriella hygida]